MIDKSASTKPVSPSCERNRDPILDVLRVHFGDRRQVLEIGSGTGQHAVHFAAAMPWLTWQCSDRAENLPGIRQWLDEAGLANTPAPIELDVRGRWPGAAGVATSRRRHAVVTPTTASALWERRKSRQVLDAATTMTATFDAVFSANTLHIMSWPQVEAFFGVVDAVLGKSSGASAALQGRAMLVIYGPFNYGGAYSSDSNRDFDGWLRARDPQSGIRDFEAVDALAQSIGLRLVDDIAMPANNRCIVWQTD